MTSEHLLDAIGLLDDGLIREAEEYVPRKKRARYGAWLGLAACFALVVVLGYGVTHLRMGGGAASGGANAPSAPSGNTMPAPGEPAASSESQVGAAGGDMSGGGTPGAPVGNSGEEDYCAAVMADGVLYWSTGTPVPVEPAEEEIRTVTGYTDTVPEEDGQTNFDRELTTQYARVKMGEEWKLAVAIGHEWILFDPVPPWEK